MASDTYTLGPDIPIPGYAMCFSKWDATNTVYMFGGDLTGGVANNVYGYNIDTQTFSSLAPLTMARVYHRCHLQSTLGKVVVAGGVDATWQNTEQVQIYDIQTNVWNLAQSLPNANARWFIYTVEEDMSINAYQLMVGYSYKYDMDLDMWIQNPSARVTEENKSIDIGVVNIDKLPECLENE